MKLGDGSRVGIVGGGPAGCFAALHAQKLALESGLRIQLIVFEPSPNETDKKSIFCKGCAGVLSSRLLECLEQLGVSIPKSVVQEEILSFVVHIPEGLFFLNKPDPSGRVVSVYRGGLPGVSTNIPFSSFDEYLRQTVGSRGVEIIRQRVRQVDLADSPVIITDIGKYQVDFVVLAVGVNALKNSPLFPQYSPPRTRQMSQAEVKRPAIWPKGRLATFFGSPRELFFGAGVPKNNYINFSLLSRSLQKGRSIEDFLLAGVGRIKTFFPELPEIICRCQPKIAVSLAKTYYGDRWVAIGDAAATRLYKDGIGSAFRTARKAMTVAFKHGISAKDFRLGYAPLCNAINWDNYLGLFLFRFAAFVMCFRIVTNALVTSIRKEQATSDLTILHRPYSKALWGLFTGELFYREIFLELFKPIRILRFVITMLLKR